VNQGNVTVRLASSAEEVAAAQRLRYDVFVAELGGDGPLVDHQNRLEQDRFDRYADHLIAVDHSASDQVVGVYRLLRQDQARQAGQFYTEDEFDLSPLLGSGRRLLELGRSCLHPAHRGGGAMFRLWQALAAYVTGHGIEILFGTASFHGTDKAQLAEPLSFLHHRHLAPAAQRVRARAYESINLMPADAMDRRRAMRAMPALIRAYLRLGGCIGDGAYIDHDFNTIDVCLVMDTQQISDQKKALYTRERQS
jgi:putative hemolysin